MATDWKLCALDQEELADLGDRQPGATIEISRHSARLASLTLAGHDAASAFASTGDAVLKVKPEDWSQPLFCGRVNTRKPTLSGNDAPAPLTAADPLAQLSQAIIRVWDTSATPDAFIWRAYGSQQPDDLIASLITDHAPDAGIAIGTTPGGATAREIDFPLASTVLDSILSVTGMDDSVEFELTPTEAVDGTLATLNCFYPQQGSDLSGSVEIKIGVDEDDNAIAFSYEEALVDLVNRHLAIGDVIGTVSKGGLDYPAHYLYIAEHAASVAQYGAFESTSSHSAVTDPAFLEDYAKALVAANAYPIGDFSVTLDPTADIDFSPDGDFWIGDVVTVTAGLPQETLNLTGRAASATFTEQENGEWEIDVAFELEADIGGVSGDLYNAVTGVAADGSAPTAPEAPEAPASKPPKPKDPKGHRWVWDPIASQWVLKPKKKGKKK